MSFIITKDDVGRMVRLRNGASGTITSWDTGEADYPATIESASAGGTLRYAASGRLYLSFTHPFDAVGFIDEEEEEEADEKTQTQSPFMSVLNQRCRDFASANGLDIVWDRPQGLKSCGVCALLGHGLCALAPCGGIGHFVKALEKPQPSVAASPQTESDPTGRAPGSPGAKLDAGKAPVLRGVIQYFPRAILAVAEVSAHGASKYTWNGWETVPDGPARYGDALVRHLCKEAIE